MKVIIVLSKALGIENLRKHLHNQVDDIQAENLLKVDNKNLKIQDPKVAQKELIK